MLGEIYATIPRTGRTRQIGELTEYGLCPKFCPQCSRNGHLPSSLDARSSLSCLHCMMHRSFWPMESRWLCPIDQRNREIPSPCPLPGESNPWNERLKAHRAKGRHERADAQS